MFFVMYVSVYLSHASSSGSFPEVFLHVFLYGAVLLSRLKHVPGIVRFVPLVPCVSDVFFYLSRNIFHFFQYMYLVASFGFYVV